MVESVRETIDPRQIGILLAGLMLIAYGAIGLWGGEFLPQNLLIIALLAGVVLAVVLVGQMMN